MKTSAKKKRVKGMTLVEIVLAMFVFGVAALIMVTIVTNSMNFVRNASHVNNKVTREAPISELQKTDNAEKIQENTVIKVTVGGKTATVHGDLYSTKSAAAGDPLAQTNADIDLMFVDMSPDDTP